MKKHNNKKRVVTTKIRSVTSKKTVDYDADPVFEAKAQKAVDFLKKYGFPPDFLKK